MLAIADSIETDSNSLLQCFSLMQDDPETRLKNRVPVPKREILSEDDILDKAFETLFEDWKTYYDKLNSEKGAI